MGSEERAVGSEESAVRSEDLESTPTISFNECVVFRTGVNFVF